MLGITLAYISKKNAASPNGAKHRGNARAPANALLRNGLRQYITTQMLSLMIT